MMTLSIRATPRAVICLSGSEEGREGEEKNQEGRRRAQSLQRLNAAGEGKMSESRKRSSVWMLLLSSFFFGFHFVYSYARIFL